GGAAVDHLKRRVGGGYRPRRGGGTALLEAGVAEQLRCRATAGRRRGRLVALRALAERVHRGDLVEVGLAVSEACVGARQHGAEVAAAARRQQRLAAA